MKARRTRSIVFDAVMAGVLLVIFLLPLAWMLSTSLKSNLDTVRDPGFFPQHPTLENYIQILDPANNYPVMSWLLNSVIVATSGAALTIVLATLSGYAFARMEFVGRSFLFGLLLATFLLPGMIFLVPQYLLAFNLGLYNTLAGLVIPGLSGAFGVVFMRQFFVSFPLELEEAAAIDGAGTIRTLIRVVLPLSGAPIATLGTISFLGYWNDYLWPLVMCQGPGCTLSAGLANFQGQYNYNYGVLMAGAVIAAVPILIAFLVAQKWIVRSIAYTGVRG